jgi:hypothetical protein
MVFISIMFEGAVMGSIRNSLRKHLLPAWAFKKELASGSFRILFGVGRCNILLNLFNIS